MNETNLSALRVDAGLSRTRLAELAGVSRVTVYRAEHRTNAISAPVLRALADVLNQELGRTDIRPSELLKDEQKT